MFQQFLTHGYQALQPFIQYYCPTADLVIDPFAGQGHLLRLFDHTRTLAIDIDPKVKPDIVADTLRALPLAPLKCLVITNPPYCHRHILQKKNPELYQIVIRAGYIDLYEYSISRIIHQLNFPPTFALLPENFIAGRRGELRKELYQHIKAIQIHTTSTCEDTSQPTILAYLHPKSVESTDLWLDDKYIKTIKIGPDGLQPNLKDRGNFVDFGFKAGQTIKQRATSILLQSTDGGSERNRIRLMRVYEKFGTKYYPGKPSDRAYVQIVPRVPLSEYQICLLIVRFNIWVDNWRAITHGLGLTSFRSNTGAGFRRKRIDWKLARLIINDCILNRTIKNRTVNIKTVHI